MLLSFWNILSISIGTMLSIYLTFFITRSIRIYHDFRKNFPRIIFGCTCASIGTGIILAIGLCCLLPTYYLLFETNSNGYIKHYVLNEDFFEDYGRTYIYNVSDRTCYLYPMEYGTKSTGILEYYEIQVDDVILAPEGVDEWFLPFPEHILLLPPFDEIFTHIKKWHVLTEEMLMEEKKNDDKKSNLK